MSCIVDSLASGESERPCATNAKNKWLRPGYKKAATLGMDKLFGVVNYLATHPQAILEYSRKSIHLPDGI